MIEELGIERFKFGGCIACDKYKHDVCHDSRRLNAHQLFLAHG